VGRFHRGLSLALVVLATLIVLAMMGWHHRLHELILLAGTLVCIALVGQRLVRTFRASPANFPGTGSMVAFFRRSQPSCICQSTRYTAHDDAYDGFMRLAR